MALQKRERKSSPNGENGKELLDFLKRLTDRISPKEKELSVILAAGHGKRIKSERSKMLHEIWGRPTIERVSESVRKGLSSQNQVIVVGIKAREVAEAIGARKGLVFAYQAERRGTGHAAQVALAALKGQKLPETLYVFPGDMGLITAEAVRKFKRDFKRSKLDMMVMTGLYEGDSRENYYGRIVRVPDRDIKGASAGKDKGRVAAILEHRDILSLSEETPYRFEYNGRTYARTKRELLDIREFNSGVYAFKADLLKKMVGRLGASNIQKEIYLTDTITLFNQRGYKVGASPVLDAMVVLGFNNKSVLKQMENIYRQRVYDRLKDIITIVDEENFFIADEVVDEIIKMDGKGITLDIQIGPGAHVGPQVKMNRGVRISTNARLKGGVILGEDVHIGSSAYLNTYPGQTIRIGEGAELLYGVNINGNVEIGEHARIESSVRITGSDEWPARIGDHVLIKGTTYIFGSTIEPDILVEHCVLIQMHVERILRKDGTVQDVRYFLPLPEGLDSLQPLQGTKERPAFRRGRHTTPSRKKDRSR